MVLQVGQALKVTELLLVIKVLKVELPPPGRAGHPGPRGPQGEPGDTVLTEKEFNIVTNSVRKSVLNDVNDTVTNKFDDVCKKVEKLNTTAQVCYVRFWT